MTTRKKTAKKKVAVKKKTTVRKKAAAVKKKVTKKKTVKKIAVKQNTIQPEEPLLGYDPLAGLGIEEDETGAIIDTEDDSEAPLLVHDPIAMLSEADAFDTSELNVAEPEPEPEPEPIIAEETSTEKEDTIMTTEQTTEAGLAVDNPLVDLGSDLTISEAESRKIEFDHIIDDGFAVKLKANEVEHVDGAGIQLLAVLFKQAKKDNLELGWESVSKELMNAVELMGLKEHLNMQDVEPEDDGEGSAWGLF